jgi:hypothetical protein
MSLQVLGIATYWPGGFFFALIPGFIEEFGK